ncbi:MAG: hypothetical protein ACR2OZ_09375 [Verrucomicrobiales bacterium]
MNALLKWASSRRVAIAGVVGLSGLGVWCLFLAAIGFHYDMVPADALDHMRGRTRIIRWVDEAIFGLPVAIFWNWCSLLGGLAICAFTIYAAYQLQTSTHDFKTNTQPL